MVVSIHFHGLQRKVTRAEEIQVPYRKSMRVTDVLKTVQERYPDLALSRESFLVTVNDRVARMDRILKANDRISFLPHIGGG